MKNSGYIITNAQAHHIFPQVLRDKMFKIGINVDEPKYLVWVESKSGYAYNHQSFSPKG